jgi:hypothetical protein
MPNLRAFFGRGLDLDQSARATALRGDLRATITQVWHFLDSRELLRPLADTADQA